MTSPSSPTTNCTSLHTAERSTTWLMSLRLPMEVRRYRRLNKPKHQSGVNLVCPTTKKDKVILVCLFVRTLQARYCIMALFLFCPVQLSAWRYTSFSPIVKTIIVIIITVFQFFYVVAHPGCGARRSSEAG